MKKIFGPLIVILLLVSLASADNVTIETDKKIYNQGEIVNFTMYNKNSVPIEMDFKWSILDNNTGNCVSTCIWSAIYSPITIPPGGNYSWAWNQKSENGKMGPGYYRSVLNRHYSNVFEIKGVEMILAHYRELGQYPNIVETGDLLKALDDWKNNNVLPGFSESISTGQLLILAEEWRNS
jgi:hypothetical protein